MTNTRASTPYEAIQSAILPARIHSRYSSCFACSNFWLQPPNDSDGSCSCRSSDARYEWRHFNLDEGLAACVQLDTMGSLRPAKAHIDDSMAWLQIATLILTRSCLVQRALLKTLRLALRYFAWPAIPMVGQSDLSPPVAPRPRHSYALPVKSSS